MKCLLLTLTLLGATVAQAYEYKLQFSAAGALGLVVAGYEFSGTTVVGNCSYYTMSASSGRGGHSVRTNHFNTCTWDLYGNLVSLAPVTGVMPAPPPITTTGTEIVYAISGTGTTGQDTRGFGFVNTRSAHYTWETPSGGYAVIPYAVHPITATLISDGDFALQFTGANVTPSISGYITPAPGTATVSATTCTNPVAVGKTCSVTVVYNPTSIQCTGSPYGYAYTRINLSLVTDAGVNSDFTEGFTITGIPVCDD